MQMKKNSLVGFALTSLLVSITFSAITKGSEGVHLEIVDFYSCDTRGDPLDYFPKLSKAYFNVTIRNFVVDRKNVSIYLCVHDELDVPIGSDELSTTIPSNASRYYKMAIFIPKWAFIGTATAYVSILEEGNPIDFETTEFDIGPEDTTPPIVHVLFPENATYATNSIPLTFTVNERTSWIGYSLNNLENVTIAGNTTLTGLLAGAYSIIVYANDTSNNTGSSDKVYFIISVVHDVAVVDVTFSSAEIYIGQVVNITVVVQNEGTMTETFNVTARYNVTVIQTKNVTNLSPGSEENITFTWNTTYVTLSNYTISAQASTVTNETDIDDNIFIDGTIHVLPPLAATVDFEPEFLSLWIKKSWFTCHMELPDGYNASDINIYTIFLNSTILVDLTGSIIFGDCDNDTVFDLTVQFNRTDVIEYIQSQGLRYGNVSLAIVGKLYNEVPFEGCDVIKVRMPGDVNCDGKVNMRDIGIICSSFGAYPTHPRWNSEADMNEDNTINMKDLGTVCTNYGKEWTD